ncbi:hypothetical protein [Kineothrix sp. MB12-C1]|uniref:hypothetical protein n=1 Tax=Kineothrix sp. MB12-C1 TaxID=3070215 RepID=UPI0027D32F1C|nr:hypothetical protein [Kineothrix sp. MB12-C1]WMC93360.1 hypothetical protein RBB56_03495 [Kineothrix sp. MB12-C1]
MIKGTEIDFVVRNSLKALELYKEIFDIKVVEATEYPGGSSQQFHIRRSVRVHVDAASNISSLEF